MHWSWVDTILLFCMVNAAFLTIAMLNEGRLRKRRWLRRLFIVFEFFVLCSIFGVFLFQR